MKIVADIIKFLNRFSPSVLPVAGPSLDRMT